MEVVVVEGAVLSPAGRAEEALSLLLLQLPPPNPRTVMGVGVV